MIYIFVLHFSVHDNYDHSYTQREDDKRTYLAELFHLLVFLTHQHADAQY